MENAGHTCAYISVSFLKMVSGAQVTYEFGSGYTFAPSFCSLDMTRRFLVIVNESSSFYLFLLRTLTNSILWHSVERYVAPLGYKVVRLLAGKN